MWLSYLELLETLFFANYTAAQNTVTGEELKKKTKPHPLVTGNLDKQQQS